MRFLTLVILYGTLQAVDGSKTRAGVARREDGPVVMAATSSDRGTVNIKPAWSQEASIRGWKIIRTSSKSNTGVTHVFKELFDQTPESNSVELGRIEYATTVVSSCIYSGVNNYIYELDREHI